MSSDCHHLQLAVGPWAGHLPSPFSGSGPAYSSNTTALGPCLSWVQPVPSEEVWSLHS